MCSICRECKRKRMDEHDFVDKVVKDECVRNQAVKDADRIKDYMIPFGKHKGEKICHVPITYLVWLAGFRYQNGNFIEIKDNEAHDFVSNAYPLTIQHAKTYLQPRCWVCETTNKRFLSSKLCTSCWYETARDCGKQKI